MDRNKFPKRKPTRLQNYDYSSPGAYFITICTQGKKCILSDIVGEGSPLPYERPTLSLHIAPGTYAVSPVPELTRYGEIVDGLIKIIPVKYNSVFVDRYVIMPNHIHVLLSVIPSDNSGRGDPSPTATVSIERITGWLKYQATKEINAVRQTPGERVFQRSFYDHVIRCRDDYDEIYKYIAENPLKWQSDCFYTH